LAHLKLEQTLKEEKRNKIIYNFYFQKYISDHKFLWFSHIRFFFVQQKSTQVSCIIVTFVQLWFNSISVFDTETKLINTSYMKRQMYLQHVFFTVFIYFAHGRKSNYDSRIIDFFLK
jgi:hypothetical protein